MPMPYGCLNSERLSQASRIALEKALDWWQKSMRTSKHKTFFVLAGYEEDGGREIELRKEFLTGKIQDPELLSNLVQITAANEVGLAKKLARIREILPVETVTLFAESRNAVSVKAIFRRKFGKTVQIRKFKANFEFNHHWISTSTSFAWLFRNWFLCLWFEAKRRMGRGLRKKIRYMFR